MTDTVTYLAPCDLCDNRDAEWASNTVMYYPPSGAADAHADAHVTYCTCTDTPATART